jgi:tetratricopeptide (TPR) repeat protein
LAREQSQAESKEKVLPALDQMASRLRRWLGGSLASIQKLDAPIEATTSSLDALKSFSLGESQRDKGDYQAAIPFYKRAVELDPNFALAYRQAGGREAQPPTAGARGRVLQEGLCPFGQFERAAEQAREGLRLNPNSPTLYMNLIRAYVATNRYEEAKTVAEQAVTRKADSAFIHFQLFNIAFAQGDVAAMEREVRWAKGKPGEHNLLSAQAGAGAFSGQLGRARQLRKQAVEVAARAGPEEAAAGFLAAQAQCEAVYGNAHAAQERATAALSLSRGPDANYQASLSLALTGAAGGAQRLIDELARRSPTDTLLNAVSLPTARAAIELHRGNAGKAIEVVDCPFVFTGCRAASSARIGAS